MQNALQENKRHVRLKDTGFKKKMTVPTKIHATSCNTAKMITKSKKMYKNARGGHRGQTKEG